MEILKSLFCEKMASKPSNFTGLPYKVYVSRNDPKNKHNRPRIKLFANNGLEWSVSFDDKIQVVAGDHNKINSKDWKMVVKWITLNKTNLDLVWNGKMNPEDFFGKSKRITETVE